MLDLRSGHHGCAHRAWPKPRGAAACSIELIGIEYLAASMLTVEATKNGDHASQIRWPQQRFLDLICNPVIPVG
jgi:hypothetical protein